MKPASFEYFRPESLVQAVTLLQSCGDDARPLAGGQSLAPMMNMRLAQPTHLVDLRLISDLQGIGENRGALEIGAMTSHHAVATSALVKSRCPLLAQAAASIAHYAIRTQGTLGGSLAHADPAAQLPVVSVALDAQFRLVGPAGERMVPARSFFQGLMTTSLQAAELLVSARFTSITPGQGQSYRHFNLRDGDFAIVSVAADLKLHGNALAWLRIALGGVAPAPVLLDPLFLDLIGTKADAYLAKTLAQRARAQVRPFDSPGVSAEFRSELIEVLVEHACHEALDRARASGRGATQ